MRLPPPIAPPAEDGRVERELRADLQNSVRHSDCAESGSELLFEVGGRERLDMIWPKPNYIVNTADNFEKRVASDRPWNLLQIIPKHLRPVTAREQLEWFSERVAVAEAMKGAKHALELAPGEQLRKLLTMAMRLSNLKSRQDGRARVVRGTLQCRRSILLRRIQEPR